MGCGSAGHHIVGEIATAYLTAHAKQEIAPSLRRISIRIRNRQAERPLTHVLIEIARPFNWRVRLITSRWWAEQARKMARVRAFQGRAAG
jgi:hypothetical protein